MNDQPRLPPVVIMEVIWHCQEGHIFHIPYHSPFALVGPSPWFCPICRQPTIWVYQFRSTSYLRRTVCLLPGVPDIGLRLLERGIE